MGLHTFEIKLKDRNKKKKHFFFLFEDAQCILILFGRQKKIKN